MKQIAPDGVMPTMALKVLWFLYELKVSCCATGLDDLLAARGVGLNIPPSKLQPQLTEDELVETRRIASVRIHMERAIGRLKQCHILDSIPNTMAGMADRIFFMH